MDSVIQFENVRFRYPDAEAWALRDVTLSIPAGSFTAVLGHNE